MLVTLVYVTVTPGYIDGFLEATRANHMASIQEPGNLRFDVLQSDSNPTQFVLYEAYKTAADAAAHKQTGHYLLWRDTVADWMAKPREGVVYCGIYPAQGSVE